MSRTRIDYDAIVVGARCAGAPAAMLLARAGGRVLLVDRARFPSDAISGHAIRQPGVAYFKQWALLDSVLATGAPPIFKMTIGVGDKVLPAPERRPDTLPVIGPRRTLLDLTLLEAAAAAGVEVHDGTIVSGLLREDGQVFGIEANTGSGRSLRARAPIVIGADGKQSFIAQQVGAEYSHYQAPVSFVYYTYWSGRPLDHVAMYIGRGRAAGMLPTHDGQVSVRAAQVEGSRRISRRRYGQLSVDVALVPRDRRSIVRCCPRTSCGACWTCPGFFASRTVRAGLWLGMPRTTKIRSSRVGSQMHFMMPTCCRAQSRAVAGSFGGEKDLLPALACYQQQREASSRPLNALNHRVAELPADPHEIERRVVGLLLAEASLGGVVS